MTSNNLKLGEIYYLVSFDDFDLEYPIIESAKFVGVERNEFLQFDICGFNGDEKRVSFDLEALETIIYSLEELIPLVQKCLAGGLAKQ